MLVSLLARQTALTLLPASSALALISLSLRPSFIPLAFLLTILLLYTRTSALGRYAAPKVVALWIVLSTSVAVSHLKPSLSALATPSTSIASLALLSALSSFVALIPVVGRNSIRPREARAQIFVFPVLWTTTWLIVSRISPFGRLITWSPLSGVEAYQWLRSFLGFSGIDFVTAMWASVAAEGLGNVIVEHEDELPPIHLEDDQHPPSSTKRSSGHLVPSIIILLALTLPSFHVNTLPLPPFSGDTNPLVVGCILPSRSKLSDGDQLSLFLKETSLYVSEAKILIWPESAVRFETESAKKSAFEQIQTIASEKKVWIGVSFDDVISNGDSSTYGKHRNGFVLVGPSGIQEPYYKRNLVPIAESFSYIPGREDPKILKIAVPISNKYKKTQKPWNLSTSSSICLDFSSPLTSLTSRPSLILAPAKTWHIGVGHAMYELARARAQEIGAEILWCDGGVGGLSGVAGNIQVGEGSWVKSIGIPSPENDRRTVYGMCGDWLPMALLLGIFGSLWIVPGGTHDIKELPFSVITWSKPHLAGLVARARALTGRTQSTATSQEPQLLINTSD